MKIKEIEKYITDIVTNLFKEDGYLGTLELTEHLYENKGQHVEHQINFLNDDDTTTIVYFKTTKEVEGKAKVYDIKIF